MSLPVYRKLWYCIHPKHKIFFPLQRPSIDHIYAEVRNCAYRLAVEGSNQQEREIQYDTYLLFLIERDLLGFVGLSHLHVI